MENLKPNEKRAKNAILLIWIVLALDFISLTSSYLQYILLQNVADGNIVSADEASANDTREQIIGIIYVIVYVVSAVTFIQWFRRAYYNLHQKTPYLSHSEGWAAGCWFIPIINLYRPYQIMKELYQNTYQILTHKGIELKSNFSTKYLAGWWTLWIISNFIGRIVFKYSMKAETIDELIYSTIASMVSNVIDIPLALITIKVIGNYAIVEPLLVDLDDNKEVSN